jgi:fatty acid-binding protein DegV
MFEDTIGVITDPGSGLSAAAAERLGVLLLDPEQPLAPQYRRHLEYYDRLLSLHAPPLICPVHEMASAAAAELGGRVRVINTRLGSAGLGSAVTRAAELIGEGFGEQALEAELERLVSEGRFFLATHDLDQLEKNRMIPPFAGRIGRTFDLWALMSLEKGRFTTPRPTAGSHILETIVGLLEKRYRNQRVRVRAVVGDLPAEVRNRFRDTLSSRLHLAAGSLAPMDPLARSRVGDHAMAVFAYPV